MTGYSAEEKSKLLIEFESFNKGIKQFIGKKFGEDFGEICYRHADDFFKNNSDEITPMDNPQVIGFLKYMASESENRIYPGDFVFEFVEGEDFDFGLDFKECAICKFFQEKGADEFVPYMCAMDIPESKYGCLGLKRTLTLAEVLISAISGIEKVPRLKLFLQ